MSPSPMRSRKATEDGSERRRYFRKHRSLTSLRCRFNSSFSAKYVLTIETPSRKSKYSNSPKKKKQSLIYEKNSRGIFSSRFRGPNYCGACGASVPIDASRKQTELGYASKLCPRG